MVPMLTWGLVRSNFAFATGSSCGVVLNALLHRRQVIFAGKPRPGGTPPQMRVNAPPGSGVKPKACERGALLALGLRDDLLGDVPRNLGVGVELHRVACATRRLAAEVSDVAEHLREGHEALHDAGTGPLLHGLDLTTAGVDVADDLTHVVLGRGDLDGHHRLEQHGAGLARGLLEGLRTGDLERELGGVDLVVATVEKNDADARHLVAGQDAELHGLLRTRVDRRDVLLRDAATGDLVHELVRGVPALDRLDRDLHLGELTGTTGLLLVRVVVTLDGLTD